MTAEKVEQVSCVYQKISSAEIANCGTWVITETAITSVAIRNSYCDFRIFLVQSTPILFSCVGQVS